MLAGYAVAVQLLLMSRVPVVDRGVGSDRLARWHAFCGQYTVGLIVAHTLLITWGYAVSAHQGMVRQAGTLVTSYPDVLMATAALGLFLLVGALSVRAVHRRLRYETWYYVHLYTYLALALAFAHVFADGNEFRSSLAARACWVALYTGTGLVLFTYRIAVPALGALRHRLRVAAVRTEAPGVTSLHIAGRDLAALRARPGQFFRWRFLTRDGWWQSHPFSVSAIPSRRKGRLRITVKALGDYTTALQHTRPGTRVIAEGPYGALTPQGAPAARSRCWRRSGRSPKPSPSARQARPCCSTGSTGSARSCSAPSSTHCPAAAISTCVIWPGHRGHLPTCSSAGG